MVRYYSTQPPSVTSLYNQQPYRTRYVFADNYRSNVSIGQSPIRQIRSNRSSGTNSAHASLLSDFGRQRPRTTARFNEMPSLNYRELYNKAVMKNSAYRRDEAKQRSYYWPERRENSEWHSYPSSSRQGDRFSTNRYPANPPKKYAPYRDLNTRPYERRTNVPPIRRLAAGGSDQPAGHTRHRFIKPLQRLVDTFPTLQRTRTKHEAAKKSLKENEIKEKAEVETVKAKKTETVTIHIASLKPNTKMNASEPSANTPIQPKSKIAQPEAQLILLECQNLILRFMLGEKERKLKTSKGTEEGEIEEGQSSKSDLPNQNKAIEEVDEEGSDVPELKSQQMSDPPDDPKMKPHSKTAAVGSPNSESSMDPHSLPKPASTKAAHAASSTGGTPLSCSSFEERVERSEISTLQRLLNRKETELSVVHDKCHRLENLLKELELKCKANLEETDC